MLACLVGIGGFIGAILRFWFARRWNTCNFPWGTLLVNGCGTLLLGWLIASSSNEKLLVLIGSGILGAMTTFSTIQIELLTMLKKRSWRKFFLYLMAAYILGIIFALIGFNVGLK